MIDGFSGHGDKEDLDKYIEGFKTKPKQVFLVHGEEEQLEGFSARLRDKYNLKTIIPNPDQTFEISCTDCVDNTPEPNREITKQSFKRLELLNMIKRVKDEVEDLTDMISNDMLNSMEDANIKESISRYSDIEEDIYTLLNILEKKNDK